MQSGYGNKNRLGAIAVIALALLSLAVPAYAFS